MEAGEASDHEDTGSTDSEAEDNAKEEEDAKKKNNRTNSSGSSESITSFGRT